MNEQKISLDAQTIVKLNNFVFLMLAYCTKKVFDSDKECMDKKNIDFLYWMYYGNLIIILSLVIFMILYKFGLLDHLMKSCGAVCVTL